MRRVQQIYQNQTMNVEACKECGSYFKTRLYMWKRAKRAVRILRPDYECGSVERVQEEFQDQTINVEVCEDCRKIFKTKL